MLTKDKQNVPVSEITKENYLVPKGEEKLYHVKLEVKSFDSHTGKKLSHPFIQKFARIDFENGTLSLLRQQGYDIEVLHNPQEWIKNHAEEVARAKEKKAADAKAKAERAEAEKQAERERLKAELRDEVEAEMKAEAKAKSKGKPKKDEKPADPAPTNENPSADPANEDTSADPAPANEDPTAEPEPVNEDPDLM